MVQGGHTQFLDGKNFLTVMILTGLFVTNNRITSVCIMTTDSFSSMR